MWSSGPGKLVEFKSLCLGRGSLRMSTGWGRNSWRAALQDGFGHSSGSKAGHEPGVCVCTSKAKRHHDSVPFRRDSPPSSAAPAPGSPAQEGPVGAKPWRCSEGWSPLGARLGELEVSTWRRLWRDLKAPSSA